MPGRKYDDEELRNLWDLAMEQGWDQLEPGERIAVSRWCRRTGHDIPRDVPSESTGPVPVGGDRAAGDGSAGQRRDVDAGVVPSEPVEEVPVGMDRHRGGVVDEDLREVERLRSIRFVDRFPDDIVTHRTVRWKGVADTLRHFPQKPAIIATGMPKGSAMDLRGRVRRGATGSWAPCGSFRCEIAPTRAKDSVGDSGGERLYDVYAQYVGGDGGDGGRA